MFKIDCVHCVYQALYLYNGIICFVQLIIKTTGISQTHLKYSFSMGIPQSCCSYNVRRWRNWTHPESNSNNGVEAFYYLHWSVRQGQPLTKDSSIACITKKNSGSYYKRTEFVWN